MKDNPTPSNRRWSNRAITREVDHLRARWLWGLLAGVVLASVPFVVYLIHQNECLTLSYRVNELRTENDLLLEEQRRLTLRQATLESPDGIEKWALGRQGLVHSESEDVVVVRRKHADRGDLVARKR